MENQGLPKVLVLGLVGVILLFIFGSSMFVTINPGQKGVLFETLGEGLDKETVYGQGLHIIAPWNDMIVYDVKETETFEKMEVLSKNGLSIKIDLSILHHPVQDKIGYLHDNIGKNYLEKIIKPAVRSVTREVIGNYLPEELYSTKRTEIEQEIYDQTNEIV
ncbi:MAG: prohibitin family protein, partial [Flavobacteriales bacterium]|nr:prohibitin family protein [Flavobacteriales bacterium]